MKTRHSETKHEEESVGSPPKHRSPLPSPNPSRKAKTEDIDHLKAMRRGRSMADLFRHTRKPTFECSEAPNPYDNLILTLEEQHAVGQRMLQKRPHDLMIVLTRKSRENEEARLCYTSVTVESNDETVVIDPEEIRMQKGTNGDLFYQLLDSIYNAGYTKNNAGKESIADQVSFLFSEARFEDCYLTLEQIRERLPAYPVLQALNPVQGGIFEVFQLAMPIIFPHIGSRNLTEEVNMDGVSRYTFRTKKHGEQSIHIKITDIGQAIITQSQDYETKLHVYQKIPLEEGEKESKHRIAKVTELAIGKLTIITSFTLDKPVKQRESHVPYMKINIHPCNIMCKTKRAIKKEWSKIDDYHEDVPHDEMVELLMNARKELEESFKTHLKPGKYSLPNKNIVRCKEAKEKKK